MKRAELALLYITIAGTPWMWAWLTSKLANKPIIPASILEAALLTFDPVMLACAVWLGRMSVKEKT